MAAEVASRSGQGGARPLRALVARSASAVAAWWRSEGVREVRRLAILPALISFIMLWPALLNLGVLAPGDIIANDPLIGGTTPGSPRVQAENPVLSDIVDSLIPWRLYARSELEAGRFPLWNPYNLLGTHLHANLQSATFSPWNLLWLLLPAVWGLGAVTFIKWTLCGLGMALLLRRLGLGMAPAIYGSVALQLSAPIVGWLQWTIGDGLIWVPWMLWAVLGWLQTSRLSWLAALAFFVYGEFAASHIETSFHSILFASAFALAGLASLWWQTRRAPGAWRSTLRPTLGLLGAGVLGLALGTVQVLPMLDILTASFQWGQRAGTVLSQVSLEPTTWLLWLTGNGLGWPDAYAGPGNWVENNPYVGVITIPLAAVGLLFWILDFGFWKRHPKATIQNPKSKIQNPAGFWVVIGLIAASMAYGLPPLSFLRELPGFNTSINTRLITIAGFCVIVLGAMGLERLLQVGKRVLSNWWALAAVAFGYVGLLFLGRGLLIFDVDSQAQTAFTKSWKMWAAALVCLLAAVVLARLLGWITPGRMAFLVTTMLLADLVMTGWNFNPTAPFSTFYPKNDLTNFLASNGPTQRVAVVGPYASSDMLLPLRVPDFRDYDATLDNRYIEYLHWLSPETIHARDPYYLTHMILLQPSATLLSAIGIQWLVVPTNQNPNSWQPPGDRGDVYKWTMRSHDFDVYRNVYARPFAYYATRFRTAPDKDTVARRMKALTFDRINEAQIEDPGGTFPPDVAGTHTGEPATEQEVASFKVDSYLPGDIRLSMTLEKKRFVVVNEGWSSGWRAYVDGSPTQIYRTNYLAQGVVVPPGAHNVRFQYDPPAFKAGLAISGVGLVAWLGLVGISVWSAMRRRRSAGAGQA